jgi:hypothetical protein
VYLSVSVCISLYQSVSVCISLYQSSSVCISLHQSVSICISLYQSVSVCISLHQSVSVCISCISLYQSVSAIWTSVIQPTRPWHPPGSGHEVAQTLSSHISVLIGVYQSASVVCISDLGRPVKSALKLVSCFLYQAVFTSEDQLTLCLPESIKVRIAKALTYLETLSLLYWQFWDEHYIIPHSSCSLVVGVVFSIMITFRSLTWSSWIQHDAGHILSNSTII